MASNTKSYGSTKARNRKYLTKEENNAANNESAVYPSPPIDGIRRSARIRNRPENLRTPTKRRSANEGRIDEPIATKIARKSVKKKASLKTNSEGKKDTNSKNKDADPKPDIVEETSYFDRLPQEIKDIIFSKLVCLHNEYDPNFRLVCKSWYDKCSQSKSIKFRDNQSIQRRAPYLGNCSYKELQLEFEWDTNEEHATDLNYMPATVWEKIGTKIHSLQFSYCRLGDRVMKSVILCCDNLKYLDVSLKTGNVAQSFCSVNALKGLRIVRPKLETLEMHTIFQDDLCTAPRVRSEIQKWSQIFANIIRIFPNITHFIFGHNGNGLNYSYKRPSFDLKFSKDELGKVDKLNLISSLAHSLSSNERKWKNAINALAKIRLTAVALGFERSRYSQEDKAALLNFFSSQKKLKIVSVRLLEFSSVIDKEMLRTVFLAIVTNSPELRQLRFFSSIKHLDWMNNNLGLLLDSSKLDEFQTGSIKIDSRYLEYDSNWFDEPPLMDWIPKYSYICHLNLSDSVPDDFLQCIFRHMISLKSLDVCLNKKNTEFALTGRRDGTQATRSGYSINRLQNLEDLKIRWVAYLESIIIISREVESDISQNEEVGVGDTIFYEFDFPKLRNLTCFPPKESSTYTEIALKMPSLTEIQFNRTLDIRLNYLLNFFRLTKKLHTLRFLKSDFLPRETKKIFDVCPSLRYLYTESHIDFYDPLTKKKHRVLQES